MVNATVAIVVCRCCRFVANVAIVVSVVVAVIIDIDVVVVTAVLIVTVVIVVVFVVVVVVTVVVVAVDKNYGFCEKCDKPSVEGKKVYLIGHSAFSPFFDVRSFLGQQQTRSHVTLTTMTMKETTLINGCRLFRRRNLNLSESVKNVI